MNAHDFNEPTQHPFDLLRGYENAYQKESVLAYILRECVCAGDLNAAVSTVHSHPTMVADGLLVAAGEKCYRLTAKAKGLLYSVYGKDNNE